VNIQAIAFGLLALPVGALAQQEDPVTVIVAAPKELVIKKLDKTVYNVSNTPRAANGSAQDVLQSTPEVSVSADGKISVKGNSQVTVLVNGKPTAMLSGEDRAVALQTMSGSDIAGVEVITNPSAAYNANGGAILNIVLKHNRKPGAHGQLRGSASDQGLWNAGLSGDATRGRTSLHGSLAFRRDGTLKFRRAAAAWNNPLSGETGQSLQTSKVFVRRIVENATLGIDNDLSDADSLSLAAAYNFRRSRPAFDALNVVRAGGSETIYHRVSIGPNQQSDGNASLSYSHQGRDTALKAMVQVSDTVALIDKSYSDVFIVPAQPAGDNHGATRSARRLGQATLDWSRQGQQVQWGAGIDVQNEINDLSNYQAAIDRLTGVEAPDPNTTNRYRAATTLSAAYLTAQVRSGRWEVLMGGRLEVMALRLTAQGLAQTGRWQAMNPSLHVKYTLGEGRGLTLSYRRSLQRPDPRDLNPFSTYVDAQNLNRGNPELRPQVLTAWELGLDADTPHTTRNVGAFYRISRDTVTDSRSFDGAVLVTSKQNGGRARSAGITGAIDWRPDKWLRAGMDAGLYGVTLLTPDLYGMVRQQGVSGYVNANAGISLKRDDLSFDIHAQSAGVTPLGCYDATSSLNVTWKRQLSKTLSLTVNASDIFDGSKRTYGTDTSTYRQAGYDHFVARRIYIGVVKTIG